MSVYENFDAEELAYWIDEWNADEELQEECTLEEFIEGIWETSPFNPESEEYISRFEILKWRIIFFFEKIMEVIR